MKLFFCFGLVVILAVGVLPRADPAVPDDVLRNSDIARQRMRRLQTGVYLYLNEQGHPPSDPAELFPRYVPDPLTFWHPGDSDPPPTTIDNSVPNAPNSARISFEWGDLNYDRPACDAPRLRDNSASNNAGYFVNLLYGGLFETDPPMATPTPTAVYMAQSRLRNLGWAMKIYANDHQGYLPNNLLRLWQSEFCRTQDFWNPGTRGPMPETFTTSEPDLPNSIQGSFLYFGTGLYIWELTPNYMLMRDARSRNNAGVGFNVLWGDFRVTFEPVSPRRRYENPDGTTNAEDWSRMNACLGGPQSPILDIRCRYFDWDSNDRVDLLDVAAFTRTHD
jgi:hypothetical protein